MVGVYVVTQIGVLLTIGCVSVSGQEIDRCSPSSPMATFCADMSYNFTVFPNVLNHSDSTAAEMEINTFSPLIQIQCSDVLKEFLCSVYFPKCSQDSGIILPCRQTCQSARLGCETLMNKFGFQWPTNLNCERFPNRNEATQCMDFTSNIPVSTTKLATTSATTDVSASGPEVDKCSPSVPLAPFCAVMAYNSTVFPNILNHPDVITAEMEINSFLPLLQIQCSDVLKEFLCSVYFPKCSLDRGIILPCRQTCQSARLGCETLMNKFGFQWPTNLNCERFPNRNEATQCMDFTSNIPVSTTKPATTSATTDVSAAEPEVDKCSPSVPMTPFCADMDYNSTVFPNILNHPDVITADMEIHSFLPLIKIQCSDVIKQFLCSVYFPKCSQDSGIILPCRQICQSARLGCETLMNKFGFQWPTNLNCERFPNLNDTTQCTYFKSNMTTTTTTTATTATSTTTAARTTMTVMPWKTKLPEFCQNLPYAEPYFPNVLGELSFQDALRSFERLDPMLWSECSSKLSQYLCLLHFPTYDDVSNKPVPPCWEFCLKVRTECLLMLPVPWPQSFSCESLPSKITPGSKCWGQDLIIHSAPSPDQVFTVVRGVFNFLRDIISFATSS